MNKKQIVGLIISIAVLVAVFFLPVPRGLTDKGLITIGVLLFFLITQTSHIIIEQNHRKSDVANIKIA